MTSEGLIELLEQRPFIPLRLHMSNGRTHEIRHPEMAIVGEGVMALGIEHDDSDRPRLRFVSVTHINEVEPISDGAGTEAS